MTKNSSKPLILVAEDDSIVRAITTKTLENIGYNVITATNGQQAVDICYKEKEQPQIILMDGSMPEVDGFEACQKLKQASNENIKNIPIILVTALDDNAAIDKAFKSGAEDYIHKPVNWHLLEHRLNVLIKKIHAEKSLRENEERFHAIADSANDAIISINDQGNITFWNQAACRIFGYTKKEIVNKPFVNLIPEEYAAKHNQEFKDINKADIGSINKGIRQFNGIKKDGVIFPLEITLSAWIVNNQRFYSYTIRDISKRLKKQEELNKLSTVVKQSPHLVIMTDLEGVIDYVNPQIQSITGFTYKEIVGSNINILCSGTTDPLVYKDILKTIKSGRTWTGILQNKKKKGRLYWAKGSISPIFSESGFISHYISIQEDITEAKALSEEISYRASHDPLTGLINRHEFETHLSSLLRESIETDQHALCFIDLDRFKIVNDTAGHLAGDELLRQLGKQMKLVGRKQDILARLGGDEFALILSHCEQKQAEKIAEKLQDIINNYQLLWHEYTFKVGASIGLVSFKKGDDANKVLKFADTACYAAKNTGRNKIYIFQKDDKYLNQQSGEIQWVSKIEYALKNNQFCLYAQQIESLKKSDVKGKCEILLRLIDKSGAVIPPGVFFPAAERFSLATKIDCWVIEHTLTWFSNNPEHLESLDCFSINLSGQTLADNKIHSFIINLIKKLQFPTQKLIFEITETAAINNLVQAQSLINNLQEIGIRFSLDDFGSGLSSFAYLKNLSVEFLKIDGMFVKDIVADPVDRAMVKSINEIGQIMGKETIAEFVENQDIVEILINIGVDYAQGYHYSKPIPLDNVF
ncbi:MAG: EAL domain-containing protein [Methylococcales bacterium]|nr:EAL domain-containing protein [Methylococcales bacterium]